MKIGNPLWRRIVRTCIVAAGIFIGILCSAQTYSYVPFPTGNATWYGRTTVCCPDNGYSWTVKTTGDTIISSQAYVVINNSDWISAGGQLFYREDSSKRVFYRGLSSITGNGVMYNLNDTIDYLVYDFGKNVGDTITTNVTLGPDSLGVYLRFVVDDIDTVLIDNGFRKKFHVHSLHCNSSGKVWIEGIGSVGGFPPNCDFESLSTLICFMQDSSVNYWNGGYCILSLHQEGFLHVGVFPNPASSQFTLQLPVKPMGHAYFVLYDAMGRQVKQQEVIAVQTVVDRGNLPCGIYYWQMTERGKALARGKLVLE